MLGDIPVNFLNPADPTNLTDFNGLNIEDEKQEILLVLGQLLSAGKPLSPSCTYYRMGQKVAHIVSPYSGDFEKLEESFFKLCMLSPGLSDTIILSLHQEVELMEGSAPAVVLIVVYGNGSIAEAFPYTLPDNSDAEVPQPAVFDYESLVKMDHIIYPIELNNVFATVFKMTQPFYRPSQMLEWLSSMGFEIQTFGDWSINSIDRLSGLS